MEKPKATPKDFFLWAGAMISLYWSVVAFITLLFSYINYVYPDVLSYRSASGYSSETSLQMASLIVLVPLFLVLMRVIRKNIDADSSRGEIWVRRWALYLTLFAAGATIAGDLITLLYYFLSGQDITIRFVLKVLVVLLVAGGGFMHFLADLWGYWGKWPARARMVGWGVGILVLVSIVSGFLIVGTPWQARQFRLDEQRVQDLQTLQSEIANYYQYKQALPGTLAQLNDPLLYNSVPVDPATGEPYEYKKTAELGFELCATFANASKENAAVRTQPVYVGGKQQADNWSHEAGHQCFVRSIDPDLFPPVNK